MYEIFLNFLLYNIYLSQYLLCSASIVMDIMSIKKESTYIYFKCGVFYFKILTYL